LPSRAKSPLLKPKLVNKYARPTARKENAQLPTKNIRNVGCSIQFNICLSNGILYIPERELFQNSTLRIFKPLAAMRWPTEHLSTFGFSLTHIANTKNQKSLNLCLRS